VAIATTTERGYGAQHQRWRARVLNRDPYCVCQGYPGCNHPRGCNHPSTDADHIDGNTHNRTDENGQGLCHECHHNKTRMSTTDKPSPACDHEGYPVDKRHPWNKA